MLFKVVDEICPNPKAALSDDCAGSFLATLLQYDGTLVLIYTEDMPIAAAALAEIEQTASQRGNKNTTTTRHAAVAETYSSKRTPASQFAMLLMKVRKDRETSILPRRSIHQHIPANMTSSQPCLKMDEYMLHVNSEVLAGRSGQRRYGGKLVDYPNGWMGVVLGKGVPLYLGIDLQDLSSWHNPCCCHFGKQQNHHGRLFCTTAHFARSIQCVALPFQDALPSNEDFPVVNCHLLRFIIQSRDLADIVTKLYKDDVHCSVTVILKQANLIAFDLINAFAVSH
ncbi:hypothetical protein LTR81_027111 [Elasticomyces elasticus]